MILNLNEAISQLHLAAEIKRKRQDKYGKADPDDRSFSFDESQIFPKDNQEASHEYQNMVLGIGNKLRPSDLFLPRGNWDPNLRTFRPQKTIDWRTQRSER